MPRLFAMIIFLGHALSPLGALAQADCRFVLGFEALRDQIPSVVGDCLEDERFDPTSGDSLQRTTGGLLRWRRADNRSSFTDGITVWTVGPDGLTAGPYDPSQSLTRGPWWDLPLPTNPVRRLAAPERAEAPTVRTPAGAVAPGMRAGDFDPSRYIGQGNAYNCDDFANQAQAQAVLRADPGDPNRLDTDRDGIACERNPAPRDSRPVPR